MGRTGGSKHKDFVSRTVCRRLRLETLEDRLTLSVGTPHVTAICPPPGAVVQAVDTIRVEFDAPVAPTSLNTASIRVYESPGDAVFGNDDDHQVWPSRVIASERAAILVFAEPLHTENVYFVQLAGSSAAASERDATELALEISGELLPPTDLHNRILLDLEAIRQFDPRMTCLGHREKWAVGELMLSLTPDAYAQYQRGDYQGLDVLNAAYGPVTISDMGFGSTVLHLKFSQPYHPERLAAVYEALDGVVYAEPNGLIGDSGTIFVSGNQYTLSYGWGDCPSGCIDEHFWTYAVADGKVQLVGESGDPLPGPNDYAWDFYLQESAVILGADAGRLDGEFPAGGTAAELPSGDGQPGGDFVSQFTVKPRSVPQSTVGLYDPATSTFHLRLENSAGTADLVFGFGVPGQGWLPVTGDWDGDGLDTAGLYDPYSSTFFLTNSNHTGFAEIEFGYGEPGRGWLPVAGDWDGDGTDTIGLYDPQESRFHLRNSLSAGYADLSYIQSSGGREVVPVAGDWDADGVASTGLYAPSTAAWDLTDPLRPSAVDAALAFGGPGAGWKPIAGDWNANGTESVGLYAPQEAACYLGDWNLTGVADHLFLFGPAENDWFPVAGRWKRPT